MSNPVLAERAPTCWRGMRSAGHPPDAAKMLFGIGRFSVLTKIVTRIEHLVRTARALLPGLPDQASAILVDAAAETADPRLRSRLRSALFSLSEGDPQTARRLLDRAVEYLDSRTGSGSRTSP